MTLICITTAIDTYAQIEPKILYLGFRSGITDVRVDVTQRIIYIRVKEAECLNMNGLHIYIPLAKMYREKNESILTDTRDMIER